MTLLPEERWAKLWRAIGAAGDPLTWHEHLVASYAEPHRSYHNQRHLAECLHWLDAAPQVGERSVAVELAIWFHDAVYDPRAADNEERSANLAAQCLTVAGISDDVVGSVRKLVMVTKHHEIGKEDHAAALIVDIDLCILGQPASRYSEYEEQVRQEYSWVPKLLFRKKRAEILKQFLARDRIYATDWFQQQFEAQARQNLEAAIKQLRRWFG
jgi:predicted metal-dependent HD superfamily phosphohydrolase